MLLPVIRIFLRLPINDRRLVGPLENGLVGRRRVAYGLRRWAPRGRPPGATATDARAASGAPAPGGSAWQT
jgi:hypothetical protein